VPVTSRTTFAGFKELGDSFRALANDMQTRGGRSATNAAAQVVKREAVAIIQHNESRDGDSIETGSLRDAVIVKRIPEAQSDVTSEHVVTVRGRGKPKNKKGQRIARAPHAHFVEFGTVNMPAEPFLRPALQGHTREATDAMAESLRRSIARAKRPAKPRKTKA
jgi:HK97 gp10 family phage protein